MPPELPPLHRDQRKIDADHLNLLAVFHFVVAGLAVAGLGFMFLHFSIMRMVFESPEMWQNGPGGPPPPQMFAMLKWMYGFFGVVMVGFGVICLLSGLSLRRRTHRLFSIVVAGIACLGFPFGTVLGVFTIVVLMRDSVREVYEAAASDRTLDAAG